MANGAPKRIKGGHPARPKRKDKRERWRNPSARDRAVNEVIALARKEAYVNEAEGPVVAMLGAAAKYAAPILAGTHGLADGEHEHAIANYLTEQLGGVLDGFDPVAYRDWRQACLVEASP